MPYELCFQSQGYKHRTKCPANFPALVLHHNDAAVPSEPEIPWEGLPSKYYPGPMVPNFCVQMGTGISNMVNPVPI